MTEEYLRPVFGSGNADDDEEDFECYIWSVYETDADFLCRSK